MSNTSTIIHSRQSPFELTNVTHTDFERFFDENFIIDDLRYCVLEKDVYWAWKSYAKGQGIDLSGFQYAHYHLLLRGVNARFEIVDNRRLIFACSWNPHSPYKEPEYTNHRPASFVDRVIATSEGREMLQRCIDEFGAIE